MEPVDLRCSRTRVLWAGGEPHLFASLAGCFTCQSKDMLLLAALHSQKPFFVTALADPPGVAGCSEDQLTDFREASSINAPE
ncbi:hypothetical protein SporoP17a_11090 [Sporosarcina ureae]|nr:hypothetical protein SporoP17a_11090 [Sporosarcina ureae]